MAGNPVAAHTIADNFDFGHQAVVDRLTPQSWLEPRSAKSKTGNKGPFSSAKNSAKSVQWITPAWQRTVRSLALSPNLVHKLSNAHHHFNVGATAPALKPKFGRPPRRQPKCTLYLVGELNSELPPCFGWFLGSTIRLEFGVYIPGPVGACKCKGQTGSVQALCLGRRLRPISCFRAAMICSGVIRLGSRSNVGSRK